MTSNRIAALAGAVLLLAALVAGCGPSEKPSAPGPAAQEPPPSPPKPPKVLPPGGNKME